MGLFKKTTISTELTSSLSHVSNTSAAAGAATPGWIDDSKSKSKTKRASGRYSKIDLKNDDLSGPTYAVKGERGRKSLRGGTKDAQGKKIQNVIKGGVRGYVEGMDAYTTLTAGQIKKEEGWFFTMKPKRWRRFMWRVIMLPDEYAPTISNPDWFKEQKNRKMLKGHVRIFREYIDYFLGVRIKSKYSYHPYKLTFDFLGFNEWQAICMYWVFSKADKDGSGIISQFEWLMYLDVEKTEFNEKVFSVVDFDESGEMDFREFCMCMWNFASATPRDLVNLAFFMYSTDGNLLQANECMKMMRQIFGDKIETSPQARKIKIELLMLIEKYNGIDLSMFGEYVKKHQHLLQDIYTFQRLLRRKCLGTKFWKRQMYKRKKKFGDKTWTDIYEELKDIADDEIRRADEYRKNKHKRALKNRIKMGFFKLPTTELFAKVEKEPKNTKPKFLTKRLKQKERYEVLDELYDGVNLEQLEQVNTSVKDVQAKLKKDGEFAHALGVGEIERLVPGTYHLTFNQLTEIDHLKKEQLDKQSTRIRMMKEKVEKQEKLPQPRGLFDYEKYDVADVKKQRKIAAAKATPASPKMEMMRFTKGYSGPAKADTVDLFAISQPKRGAVIGKVGVFGAAAAVNNINRPRDKPDLSGFIGLKNKRGALQGETAQAAEQA